MEPQPGGSTPTPQPVERAAGNAVVAMVLAWLIPGLGHVYLRRWQRGLAFLLLVVTAVVVGCTLGGNLYRPVPGQPLSYLGTLGAMGMGTLYFILRAVVNYAGDVTGAGYEYGSAFLLTAGLMNWLLVLDAWDIARGKKE